MTVVTGGLPRVPPQIAVAFALGFLPFSSHARVSAIYPSRTTMITGECEADLKPSVAVISGGVAASALKPTAAAAQLNKQLALLQAYVQQDQLR
jgi:uncharacterized protein YggE